MNRNVPRKERPELYVVPTPVEGRLLETDLELLEDLGERYQTTVLAELRSEPARQFESTLLDPMRLRPLLSKPGPAGRLLYLLRGDVPEAWGSLLLAERYRGVVLLSGGSLLGAYRELYLHRDDTTDFALELGRQWGEAAPGLFDRVMLGLSTRASEGRAQMLRTLAQRSLAVLSGDPGSLEELESIGAANRGKLLPTVYRLPAATTSGLPPGFVFTLFGESVPARLLGVALAARKVLAGRGIEIEVVVSEASPGSQADSSGFWRIPPSASLLQSSGAVLAVPEGTRTAVSAALASCLSHGSVTLSVPWTQDAELREATVALRTFPDCAEELVRVLETLWRGPKLRELLSRAARAASARFPTPSQRVAELSRVLELCQMQRPERIEPLEVWRDVVGIRIAELQSLTLRPPDPELRRWSLETARQMQRCPGGDP